MKALYWALNTVLLAVPIVVGGQAFGAGFAVQEAEGEFINLDGEPVGHASLRQGAEGTVIQIDVTGLPEGPRAIHIHEVGICDDFEDGFTASGDHLNPEGRAHGLLHPQGPDAGDLTNFYVNENGTAWAEFYNDRASLDGSFGATMLDEDGAALVIHEHPDDHGSQPIGGSGERIACAVIQAR